MAEQKLSKVLALPSTLEADTIYFEKATGDPKTKIWVTTTTTPITAIPIAYVSDAELATLLAGKQDKFTGTTSQYVRGDGSLATHDKASVGLGNVANLAPADLPVSTATTVQLDLKIPLNQKGVANGVATLDSGGKIPAAQLPSYVDDVLEFANLAAFPATGETGKIYTALDTNLIYRWSGTVYVKISSGDVTEMANFFVRYDAAQSLNSTQQQRARTNIGALGTADLSTYATIAASDAKYVRFDAATSLTAPQQTQARANIGALGSADIYASVSLNPNNGAAVSLVSGLDVNTINKASRYYATMATNLPASKTFGFVDTTPYGSDFFQTFVNQAVDDEYYYRSRNGATYRPWFQVESRQHAVATFAAKATTLSGYGITDAYTKVEVNTLVNSQNQWRATEW